MCAATARPVSFENVNRQLTTAEEPDLTAVIVNLPAARAALFGFGTSCRAFRAVRTLETDVMRRLRSAT